MVLDLLVDDEPAEHDQPDRPALVEHRDGATRIGGDRRPGERDQVEHEDDQAERDRVLNASDDKQERSDVMPASRLIAIDRSTKPPTVAVDVLADPPPPRLRASGSSS